jgi:cellulose synthase/poly-beta-1,6-N-acetylglucosamine synthase-like glycosyltransferase
VSVVVALGEEEDGIGPTLASLTRSTRRDLELIAVGGGAREIAHGWMTEHPDVAARLLAPSSPAGRGEARNAGVAAARAELCLILDPGQELYPRCLDRLVTALDENPGAAFAYPIQEVTGAPDAFVQAGGDYLMSFLEWDPARLRRGNPIHAPALIRTELLRRAGGFASDPGLGGFEDYDLWCRMAERGWGGRLVPEALTRRPESGSSDALATMHPSPGPAVQALVNRSPELLAGAFPDQS